MNELRKEIGLLQGIGLMSTSLLGMGIFVVPSVAATLSGETSLWAWPILILLIIPVALTFARLGQQFPNAGGAAYFVGRAYGPAWDKLTAVLFLSVIPVAIPAGLHIASGFWYAMFDLTPMGELLIQLLTLMLILYLGLLGAKISGNVQIAIALIIAALVVAIWYFGELTVKDSVPGDFELVAVGEAIGVIFWCFIGLEAFAHMGEEFKCPERDFPRAMVIGFVLSGIVYWAYSAAVLKFGAYGSPEQEVTSMPTILYLLFGDNARYIAGVAGYLASFASINIYQQGFARLVWAQARQERLPALLHRTSGRDVPANALITVIIVSVISTVAAAVFALPLDDLIRFTNGNFIMVYVLSMAAGWKVFRGFARWLAGFSFILSLILLSMLGTDSWYVLAIFCAYWLLVFFHSIVHRESRFKKKVTGKF
ncbi:MAG: L-methionine/branched-chain amino acid transporter [Oceanospirillales bacterium LUC14_002_19_P2]|nr:MAG: L-methionine/branched-chain amino acid transporter [Oceanospirillales bacterium LUC14_002_19_P2]